MRLSIPESEWAAINTLASASPEDWDAFTRELAGLGPSASFQDTLQNISSLAQKRFPDEADAVAGVLGNLLLAFTRPKSSIEAFVELIRNSASDADNEAARTIDWLAFESRIVGLLKGNESLSLSAKAGALVVENERVFSGVRIITDLRPVFRPEVANGVAGMVIAHQLKVAYSESHEWREVYYALDSNDLRSLRNTIERALQKQEQLEKLLDDKQIQQFPTVDDSEDG